MVLSCTPPSSAYCSQRSVSICSTALRNRKIAMSPFDGLLELSCGNANALPPMNPAPIVAAPPASTPFFRNDRRFTGRAVTRFSFSITSLLCIEKHTASRYGTHHRQAACHRKVKGMSRSRSHFVNWPSCGVLLSRSSAKDRSSLRPGALSSPFLHHHFFIAPPQSPDCNLAAYLR